jgi:nucleoside-diphosphate-sugar epimerase
MRVLLAGASGALGLPLTRRLTAAGHEVIGLCRNPAGAPALMELGAQPVVADALDRSALLHAVDGLAADAVIHELTALKKPPTRHSGMVPTDRLRSEGTANLLAAAAAIGASRFVTQSIILGYGYYDHGGVPLTEDDPFGLPTGTRSDPHVAAMLAAERQAFESGDGIALRYGMFYGGDAQQVRRLLAGRRLPVVAGGSLGWVHHEDAAAATVAALEHGRGGEAYNVVDDQPASWQEVYTAMAAAFGAPAPPRLPRWLFRLAAPYVTTFAADTSMIVANAKAKAELGWKPEFPTYREGIAAASAEGHTSRPASGA